MRIIYKQAALIWAVLSGLFPFCADIRADYEQGIAAAMRGDFLSASREFLSGSKLGEPRAQAALGLMYYGDLPGLPRDFDRAIYWFEKAAAQGEAEAQFKLGRMYDFGLGVSEDNKLAVEWYLKAAEQGHPEAQNNLASSYFLGEGVKRDFRLAHQWYRRSAEQGFIEAEYNFGAAYSNNDSGVPKDLVQSYAWWRLAAERGDERCQYLLGQLRGQLTNAEIKRAVAISDDLQHQIEARTADRAPSDLDAVVSAMLGNEDRGCIHLPDGATELQLKGFAVVRPAEGQWCLNDKIAQVEKDLGQITFVVLNKEYAYETAFALLVNLADKQIQTPKELLKLAKKTNLAERARGKPCPDYKFKYSPMEGAGSMCVRFQVTGRLESRGPRIFGAGRMCMHPNDPSVMIFAEHTTFSLQKLSKAQKSALSAKAEAFVSGITSSDFR